MLLTLHPCQGSTFYILMWVLQTALIATTGHMSTWEKVEYYCLLPVLAIPLLPMAIFDFPRKRGWIWQITLFVSTWIFQSGQVIDMTICGYYSKHSTW